MYTDCFSGESDSVFCNMLHVWNYWHYLLHLLTLFQLSNAKTITSLLIHNAIIKCLSVFLKVTCDNYYVKHSVSARRPDRVWTACWQLPPEVSQCGASACSPGIPAPSPVSPPAHISPAAADLKHVQQHQHSFNGLFSRTIRVGRCQKDKPFQIF